MVHTTFLKMAETEGFEPSTGFPVPAFQAGSLSRSVTSPYAIRNAEDVSFFSFAFESAEKIVATIQRTVHVTLLLGHHNGD